ncbi:MAG TPA: DUF6788 family protein [Halococcus sp.]|nr:DUF6788 family protein [Halococcus sp.]
MSAENPPTAPESLPKYLRKGLPKQEVDTLTDARDFIDELIEWKQRPVEDDDLPKEAEPVDDESDERGGTVVMEKVTCGDETCKCMREGEKHGPYKYHYYRKSDGTLTSDYIDNE